MRLDQSFVNGKTTTYCAFVLGHAQDVALIVTALSFASYALAQAG
jgi:hypothetical protein